MAENVGSPVNLLFTSVGRRVELLRAFRQAYRDLDLAGNVVALDIDPLAPALQVADRPYIVPRLTSPDFVPALLEICHRERISAIFPLIDPDIPLLAHHREAIEATQRRISAARGLSEWPPFVCDTQVDSTALLNRPQKHMHPMWRSPPCRTW